ncbi:MAG: hypothetical protein OXB94_02385 [Nitrospira sp.]|nr:hypothetical protein [Nitrospira sp.]
MADLFMALTSLAWGLAGLTVAVVPAMGPVWAKRILLDPWPRFWFGQVILLIGLLLMIGTTDLTAFWVWAVCGALAAIKACLLLGAPVSWRERVRQWLGTWPPWLYRAGGTIDLALAVCLAADLILHG